MQDKTYGLTIHILSFKLNDNLIRNNDKIRVSIKTYPDKKKQNFFIDPKDISNAHKYFTVNITDETRKILFTFRKKSFLQADPIIASTVIRREQLPKYQDDAVNKEKKVISLFEKLPKKKRENAEEAIDTNLEISKKLVGQMEVQFEVTDIFPEQDINFKGDKKKGNSSGKAKYAKMNLNDENMDANIYFNSNA